ncbi:MAG: dephospho-CoA kinase [Firmicutes bacterium]|nr:dephospho-CoA kinase [Bacillota bacterium]
MKVIGLTGGIGTGKSTVSAYLKQKNIPIVDADQIAREITAPGSPVLDDIRALLGDDVFSEDGTMDRQKVASVIFSNQELLSAYEALTTAEAVRRCILELEEYRQKGIYDMAVLDAPLLFECGLESQTDEDWVVDADLEIRISRVMARDSISRQAIMDRIQRQMSSEKKRELADFVIDNSGSLDELYVQVDALLERKTDER